MGVDVHLVGVVPTPALSYITGAGNFAAGIMVSASHNPARDNGLKVLDEHGLKLDEDVEDELEQLIWTSDELPGAAADALGLAVQDHGLFELYVKHRLELAAATPTRLHLVIDCANGSGGGAAARTGPTSTPIAARRLPERWRGRSSLAARMSGLRSTATPIA
jgi:phosphoglucosamine mutase